MAGASGVLGREVVRVLHDRGHWTRAICRSSARAQALPASAVVIADALHPANLHGLTNGSMRRPGYLSVDVPANLNLLRIATDGGVNRFVYVSVLHAGRFSQVSYLDAHAQVATAVKASGLSYAVIEPTGFYSHFKVLLEMAVSNRAVVFGRGNSKSNPIHEKDLAAICADSIEDKSSMVVAAAGPVVYSRRQMLEAAFEVIGEPPKIREVPLWIPVVDARIDKPVGKVAGSARRGHDGFPNGAGQR